MPDDVPVAERQVRLLINDTSGVVFSAEEISDFLLLEDDSVKRAAALAYEVIAGDEALTSKVIRTQDLATDGAKLADVLLKQAQRWRDQADQADDDADEGYFEFVAMNGPPCGPELTGTQTPYPGWL